MKTLQEILIESAAYLDLSASLPTTAEIAVRSSYANQSLWEAVSISQLPEFRQVYTSYLSGATLTLPSNFKEFMGKPHVSTGSAWEPFDEINPQDQYAKGTSDKYCYVLGNAASGHYAVFNGFTAGATVSFPYFRNPTGMATLTSVCELSDPQYVVASINSYVLQSRGDERFPFVNSEKERKLQNIVGKSMRDTTGGKSSVPRSGLSSYTID